MTRPLRLQPLRAALRGGAYASLANLTLYYAWSAASGPLMVAESPDSTRLVVLSPAFVVLSCFIPALAASAIVLLLRRVAPRRAPGIFLTISMIVLVVSMAPVVVVPTDGLATQLALGLMHVVAAAAIVTPLLRVGDGEVDRG